MPVQPRPHPQASGTAAINANNGTTTKILTSSCSARVRCPSRNGAGPAADCCWDRGCAITAALHGELRCALEGKWRPRIPRLGSLSPDTHKSPTAGSSSPA